MDAVATAQPLAVMMSLAATGVVLAASMALALLDAVVIVAPLRRA